LSIGIYLSFPFARSPAKGLEWGRFHFQRKLVKSYLDSLRQELLSNQFSGNSVRTVLLGAGDWSYVRPEGLTKLVSILKGEFSFSRGCEFTIETSYEQIGPEILLAWEELGVNRLSFNLLEVELNQLKKVVSLARAKGFESLNLDLHFGRPGQSLLAWQKDLRALTSLLPTHFSVYSFGSSSTRQNLRKEIYLWTANYLEKNGYKHYEVCHFARPGFECRQNLHYWQRKNFLGFGAGAASLWGDWRWRNAVNPVKYAGLIRSKKRAVTQKYKISLPQQKAETIYYSLRQARGLDLTRHQAGLGDQSRLLKSRMVHQLMERGYINLRGSRLSLTKEGFLKADEIIAKLIQAKNFLT